jgi:hypothetical protein
MTSTIGTQLPIWITGWNYSSGVTGDSWHTDTAFLTQWTQTALQLLATNGVQAAMHFDVDNLLPLAQADGSLATQGVVAKAEYEALAAASPPSGTPSEPDTPDWDPVCGPRTGSQSGRWR